MNLLNKNIESYSEEEVDEKYRKECADDSDNWPYKFTPNKRIMYDDYELYTSSETGSYYMGRSPRSNIEEERNDLKMYLGCREVDGSIEDVYIDSRGMRRHTAVFGRSGYGKSSLLRSMLVQTANRSSGFCYVDPKGDDSDKIMKQLPSDRMDEVVLIKPGSNKGCSIDLFSTLNTEDEGYDSEAKRIANDLVEMTGRASENELDSRAMQLVSEIVENLIKSNKEYGLENLAEILEMIVYDYYNSHLPDRLENLGEEYSDVINQKLMVEIAHLGRGEFRDILSALGTILESDAVNQLLNGSDKIQLCKAVQQNNIIIVDTSSISSYSDVNLVSSLVVSRVWSCIKNTGRSIRENDYMLCIDEFERVLGEEFGINSIISQGRSFGLSVVVSSQYPSQLSDSARMGLKQIQNVLTFNLGNNPRDPQVMVDILGGGKSWEIDRLDRFQVAGRVYKNESVSDPIMFNTYGEYPKTRSERDLQEFLD